MSHVSTATQSYAERYLEQVAIKNALVASIAAELATARQQGGKMDDEQIVRFVLTRIYP